MQSTSDFERIRELLHQKADLNVRLRLIPGSVLSPYRTSGVTLR